MTLDDETPKPGPAPGGQLWLAVLVGALATSLAAVVVLGVRHAQAPDAEPEAAQSAAPPPTLEPPVATVPVEIADEPEPASVSGGIPEPVYTEADANKTAEDAGNEFLAAARQRDGKTLAKYAPRAKLASYASEDDAVRDLCALSFDQAHVVRGKSTSGKAVVIAAASNREITDQDGKPSPIDVVLQFQRENGYWKLFRQQWLVATPLAEYEAEATNWLTNATAAVPAR